jgi:hypothetical protein
MTVSTDGPRGEARPPKAAGSFTSGLHRAFAPIAQGLSAAGALLVRAWAELKEIERREAARSTPPPERPDRRDGG